MNKFKAFFSFFFLCCITFQFIPNTAEAANYDGFEYSIVGGTSVTITGYTGASTDLVVPASIESLPVTKIGAWAFSGKSITTISIPEPIAEIGQWAFYNCSNLSSVSLPNTLRLIDDNAFLYCTFMSACSLPNGLQTIGMNAFFYCLGLQNVTIPASVTMIENSAFGMCGCIMMAKFEGNAPVCDTSIFRDTPLKWGDPSFCIYYKDSATGFTTPTWKGYYTVMVPSGLQTVSIPPWYLRVTGYTGTAANLAIPRSIDMSPVTEIGDSAFSGNTGLLSVTIPGSVTSIGAQAFSGCTGITSLTIPSSVVSISDFAFLDCANLTTLTMMGNAPAAAPSALIGFSPDVIYDADSTGYDVFPWNSLNLRPTCTVSFDAEGGNEAALQDKLHDAVYGKASDGITDAPLPGSSRTGYTFGGWWTGSGGAGTRVTDATVMTSTGNHTLYAKWIADIYTVTYDAVAGSVFPTFQQKAYDSAYGKAADGVADEPMPQPERTGYTFAGWWTEAGGTGDEVTDITIMNRLEDHTLYAKWEINMYTVQFDSQGGSTVSDISAAYNTSITTPEDPSRDNYIFGGWYTDTECTDMWDFDADHVTADMTLYAKWTGVPITGLPQTYSIYRGGRVTWDPEPPGGTWTWDETFFSAAFNSPATFTALKTGTSAITYTVGGITQSITVTVEDAVLPKTGQDFTWISLLIGCAALALAAAAIPALRRRSKV